MDYGYIRDNVTRMLGGLIPKHTTFEVGEERLKIRRLPEMDINALVNVVSPLRVFVMSGSGSGEVDVLVHDEPNYQRMLVLS